MTDTLDVGREVGRQVRRTGVHKYQAVLPDPLWEELQSLADANYTTVADLIRRFVKLGLLAADIEESGDGLR